MANEKTHDSRMVKAKKPVASKRPGIKTKGSNSFAKFLSDHSVTYDDAAEAIATTKSGVCVWATGQLRPRYEMRLAIERWTSGSVKAIDWMTDEERRVIARIKPWVAPREKRS